LTYRGMSSSERKKRVTEALERVGMGRIARSTFPASYRAVNNSASLLRVRLAVSLASC
jgi:ABC-type microcin C transport system duplicated ATPase subunit YejF